MANPVDASAFSTSVAALSITITKSDGNTGPLTIASQTSIPEAITRDFPMLFPAGTFQTNYVEERMSCGTSATTAPFWQVTWSANYIYIHAPVMAGRSPVEHLPKISTNLQAIRDVIAANVTALGVEAVYVETSELVSLVRGPDNKAYYGGPVTINVWDDRNTA